MDQEPRQNTNIHDSPGCPSPTKRRSPPEPPSKQTTSLCRAHQLDVSRLDKKSTISRRHIAEEVEMSDTAQTPRVAHPAHSLTGWFPAPPHLSRPPPAPLTPTPTATTHPPRWNASPGNRPNVPRPVSHPHPVDAATTQCTHPHSDLPPRRSPSSAALPRAGYPASRAPGSVPATSSQSWHRTGSRASPPRTRPRPLHRRHTPILPAGCSTGPESRLGTCHPPPHMGRMWSMGRTTYRVPYATRPSPISVTLS
mmetsp:Transcript_13135/g.37941  ORF Transcript_13135/g.37941 Transcript_13135/m.37941 type:complete len:253 (-) Transcript_13135:2079-2837(-)